jgi:hypothetical protein
LALLLIACYLTTCVLCVHNFSFLQDVLGGSFISTGQLAKVLLPVA